MLKVAPCVVLLLQMRWAPLVWLPSTFAQVLHCQGGTRKIHLSRLSPENSHLDTLAADEPVKRLDKSSKDFW